MRTRRNVIVSSLAGALFPTVAQAQDSTQLHREGRTLAGTLGTVFSWMRLAMVMSYRAAGPMRIPDARGTNSGAAGWMLLEFGKF